MPGTPASPQPRLSDQVSASGTIASEEELLRYGRESFIPFDAFAHAFLWREQEDLITARNIQQSVEFQQPLQDFLELASRPEILEVYVPLVQLMNCIVTQEHNAQLTQGTPAELVLQFAQTTSTQPILSPSGTQQKPDICGLQMVAGVGWNNVLVACEYKYCPLTQTVSTATTPPVTWPSLEKPHPPNRSGSGSDSQRVPAAPIEQEIRLGRYLLEMRSHQATREYVFGILFTSTHASFWYADSDSTIKSQPIPVNSPDFITALMCLARASPEKLGYSSRFRMANGSILTHQSITGARFVTSDDPSQSVTYELADEIYIARALHGRCARVLGANIPGSQERYVLKLSHQVIGRDQEATLIQKAHNNGVTGVVCLVASFTLKKLSEGPRSRLPPGLITGKPPHLLVEDRELRVLVLVRCMPLYRVPDPKEFLAASISLLNTICDLYEKAKILHRDISLNNLMVEMNNHSVGVLIDLDHAFDSINQYKDATSLHRAGTLPFMALDLLHDDEKYSQHLRDDIESFVYVICWIAGRYQSGNELSTKIFLN
ncbi:unnamed protein product [Rhizoctonia solani]|uniref:Fungal-type protein kinase domain-containing protein n=1 Tax=Rhizoctonia solani TaxID=456999 RepID=A0A8H2XQF7_9AGAM|nr:unnamed protein product [Rhizoctonia solani]